MLYCSWGWKHGKMIIHSEYQKRIFRCIRVQHFAHSVTPIPVTTLERLNPTQPVLFFLFLILFYHTTSVIRVLVVFVTITKFVRYVWTAVSTNYNYWTTTIFLFSLFFQFYLFVSMLNTRVWFWVSSRMYLRRFIMQRWF